MKFTKLFLGLMLVMAFIFATFHTEYAYADEQKKEVKDAIDASSLPLNGIWHQVKQHQVELETVIKAKQLNKVHQHAFMIRDLVNVMPAKSTSLSPAKLEKVKTSAKYLATLAARLDESGDANDQAGTEENYKKFASMLQTIEAQYSPEDLKYE